MMKFLRHTLLLIAMLMVTTNAWAWCGAKVYVNSQPTEGGWVYINTSNSGPSSWNLTAHDAQQSNVIAITKKNFTFYRFYNVNNGYTFKGWAESSTANSGDTQSSCQVTANPGVSYTEKTYYAIFATLQNLSGTPTFSNTKVDESTTATIKIKHAHAANVTLALSGTNASDFTLSKNSFNSTTAGEETITITFKPTCAGERTATLTISSNNGLSSLTVNLKANGVRHNSSIAWVEPIDANMFVGGTKDLNVTASDANAVTYTSSNTNIISVNGNKLTAIAEGEVTITATHNQTCKFNTSYITKTFTVSNKKTPTFWLNGDPNQLTDNLKTEDTRSITITNVDANMTATYDQNLLQYTFDGKTATIKALDAGTATIKFVQPETNETFYSDRTFTFYITKYTGTITNNLASSYMVDDVVPESSIYSINNNEVPVQIISSDESVLKFENGQLKAVGAGTATITVKQAETNKWVGISDSKTVTVNKYTLTAHINPTNTVWNATHSNPFSVSITPANGETITDFNVGESSNPAIATYNSSNNTLQTYYTSGDANFTITRDADRKYNALNQTLTLTVNVSTESCDINLSATNAETGTGDNSTSGTITLNGEGDILSFSYRLNDNANVAHYLTTQYSTTDTEDDFQDIANSSVGEQDETLLSHSLTLPTGTKRIRFKRTDDGWGNKKFIISNITVTRKQNITPSIAEGDTLTLPTVAIYQNCSNTFNLNWSTCSEVKIVSNSDKFTIETPDNSSKEISLTNPDGNQTFTIYCNTSETGTFEGTITIYDQADKASFNVTATVNNRWTPEMTGPESYSKLVDDAWVADFHFKNTETTTPSADQNAPFYFTIQHTSFVNDESARHPEHTNEVISYNPETYTITAHNAGTAVLTFIQKDTPGYYPASCSCTITVAKHQSNFQMKMENFTCEIDAVTDETNFFSKEAKNNVDATIDINITEIANDDHPEVLVFDNSTRKFTAASAGRAMVTISQPVHYKWTEYTGTINIEVKKHTPIFTWNDPVYFNQTISDYFTTNNNPNENEYATEVSITQESTDPDVAIIYFNQEDETDKHTLDLTTYYKETTPASSTTVTVSQAENWYWYAKEDTHTITPQNRNNQVEFTLTQENYIRDFQVEYVDPAANNKTPMGPDWQDGGIYFGGEGVLDGNEGWNWDEKYIIIKFSGIPDTLTFDASRSDAATRTIKLSVSEGTSKDNLTEIWSNSTNSTNNGIECKLNPETRFLKFSYTGNLWGLFKNINVTELNQFDAVPNSLDFGTVTLDDNPSKALNFNLHYANAGYNVTLDLDRTGGWATEEAYNLAKQYIRMEPATITTIGGEKHGTVENILVTLHSDDQTGYTIPANARLKISDEAGHTTYVNLSGKIEKSTQTITWNDYFSLQEPIQIPISTDSVRGAAKASSNLPVKYRSADDAVIKVNDNGLCFIPAGVGTTTITAYQEGNNQYAYVESTKQVQVTGKSIQLINWTDDLSDLIFYQDTEDPDSIALTAQVYIIDVVNSTFEFSQEQTDKLIYTIAEGGESIIKITNDTLTMLGIGETTITVTIEADEQHEGATMTIPVIVREPAMGCEDKILITPPSQIEFFQMNTDEISKDAIAINRAEGVPGFLLFSHIGKQWTILGMNFYTGTIKAQQSTDGGNTWQDVAGSEITPTLNKEQQTDSILLDRNATHIRFVRPAGGQGYHYVTNIKVVPVQYVEVEQNTIDFENINMGGVYQKTFTISYSNIKSPLIATTSSKDVTVEPNRWGECGDFGSKEFTVTWKPNNNQNQSITIQDTLADLSVTINLQANIQLRKQKIVWENRPTAILDHTGIDNRPLYTRDANNNELLDLPITYEVTNGSDLAYFENGMFFIINTGEITIKASNLGNNEYLAVDSTYQLIIQGIPPTFIGSTEAGADSLWTNQNNWVNGLMPTKDNTANIVAPVQVNTVINVQGIRVAEEGTIHITKEGGLTIGEKGIQTVTTDGSAIVIDNLHEGAGFLRVDPACESELPRITMRYQTRSTLDSGANKDATWQYIGAPGEDATVYVDYNTWLYRLEESQADWVLMPQLNNHTLDPFQGYALTQYGKPTYEWNAQMTNRNCTIPLTYHFDGRKGQNLIANSYTAPIDVTQMTSEDFQMIDGQNEYYDITQTLYLYNSGSWKDWHTHDSLGTGISSDGDNTTPGQYYAIPVLAVAKGYIPEKPTIAPMQGIYVRVRAKKTGGDTHVGNIIFDYDRIVMGEGHNMHRPMRAPKKSDIASIPSENFRRLRIVATSEHSGADRLYIIQDDINTRNYDNGYDAPNQATQGIVNIYTYESGGKMEVSCANNIDSTYIGFMAGEDRTYTLHFNTIVGETLCLQDLTNGEKINIVEGGTYTFEAEPQSTNNQRFLLLAPQGIKSDIDEIDSVNIWYSNRTLYITNAADNSTLQLYDVSGHQIFSTTIHRTPYTIDLTHLTEGVYMARVNNQVYKFVCK